MVSVDSYHMKKSLESLCRITYKKPRVKARKTSGNLVQLPRREKVMACMVSAERVCSHKSKVSLEVEPARLVVLRVKCKEQ